MTERPPQLPQPPQPSPPGSPPPGYLTRRALVLYPLLMVSALWLRPPGLLALHSPRSLLGVGLALMLGALGVGLSRAAVRHTAWGRELQHLLSQLLGRLSSREILLLSLLSAFGEEILFRGVIHPRLGLWPTAALFGLLHFPMQRALLPWTLMAFGMGVGLGFLTDIFGSLWPAIVLHFVINHFNLHGLLGERDSALAR